LHRKEKGKKLFTLSLSLILGSAKEKKRKGFISVSFSRLSKGIEEMFPSLGSAEGREEILSLGRSLLVQWGSL
jgi:hypothetical protein